MPNGIKYSVTAETQALKKGNFWISTGDVDKGPTPSSGYWISITPPTNGYTVYLNKPSDGPSIYTPPNDSDLIVLTKTLSGTTFPTGASALNWYNSQTDKMVFNIDYPPVVTTGLVFSLDAGFTPSYPRGGTSWYDLGPTASNGALINGPTWSSSPTGGGVISLDGVDDNVSISRTSALELQVLTVSWWIKGLKSQNTANYTNTGPGKFFNVSWASWDSNRETFANNDIKCYVYNGSSDGKVTIPNVLDGFWHNVCWSYDGSTIRGYKDGLLVGSASLAGPIVYNTGNINIGSYNNSLFFNGQYSSANIYSRILSSSEIIQNYQSMFPRLAGQNLVMQGLIGFWNAGYSPSYSGSGTSWLDISGYGATGTLNNSQAYSSANGGAIVYDGSDDYTSFSTSPTGVVTVSIWMNLAVDGNFPIILAGNTTSYDSALWNWSFYIFNNIFYVRGNSGPLGLINTPASTLVGSWNNWVLVRNDGTGTCRVYKNGILFGSSNEVSSTDGTLSFGRGGNYYNGKLSTVQIYNRPLSASDVFQNYQATLPQILGQNIVTTGMVGYWDAGYTTSYGGSGTSWGNVSGIAGATGALVNGPIYATGNGGSIVLDGVDDYIDCGNPSFLRPSSFTTIVWFYNTDSNARQQGIYCSYSELLVAGYFLQTWMSPKKIRYVVGSNTGSGAGFYTDATGSTTININTWYQVAITFDGINLKGYVNASPDLNTTAPAGVGYDVVNNKVLFGAVYTESSGPLSFFKGNIPIVSTYSRVLSDSEILQNYNAQKSRFGL